MSSIHLRIFISHTEFVEYIKRAYTKTSATMNIAGFRKGKVPAKMIDAKIGRDRIFGDAIRSAVPHFFEKVLIERALFAIGNPSFQVNIYKDGEVLKFETEVNVRPAIKLPDFAKITLRVQVFRFQMENYRLILSTQSRKRK